MLEQLADHDDELLEQLLMDQTPEPATIFADLARETGENLGVSVLFGSAASSWGVRRLLKALRHEAPGPEATATPPVGHRSRRSTPSRSAMAARSAGWRSPACSAARSPKAPTSRPRDGDTSASARCSRSRARRRTKIAKAGNGDVVAVGQGRRAEGGPVARRTGTLPPDIEVELPARNCALAIEPADRKDDVQLSSALARLAEEDAALTIEHDEASHELRLRGVNDEHLNTVIARLKRRYGVEVTSQPGRSAIANRSAGRSRQHGRHKKQSGGHGQFGDVIIEVRPLGRGEGFQFEEKIHGGAIPRQWIPAVEHGVRDAMAKGPLAASRWSMSP